MIASAVAFKDLEPVEGSLDRYAELMKREDARHEHTLVRWFLSYLISRLGLANLGI